MLEFLYLNSKLEEEKLPWKTDMGIDKKNHRHKKSHDGPNKEGNSESSFSPEIICERKCNIP